jgi:selenocysteine-specific elongation factor
VPAQPQPAGSHAKFGRTGTGSTLWLADDDRLILRDASAATPSPVHGCWNCRAGQASDARWLFAAIAVPAQTLAEQLQRQSAQQAVALDAFAWAKQLDRQAMQALLSSSQGQQVEGWLYHPEHWQSMQHTLLERLAMLHQHQPDQLGQPRQAATTGPARQTEAAVNLLLNQLLQQGRLCQTRGWLHLPEHVLSLRTGTGMAAPAPCFAGSEAQWVRDLARQHAMEEADMRRLLHKAARLGHVVAVVQDRYFSTRRAPHGRHHSHTVRAARTCRCRQLPRPAGLRPQARHPDSGVL